MNEDDHSEIELEVSFVKFDEPFSSGVETWKFSRNRVETKDEVFTYDYENFYKSNEKRLRVYKDDDIWLGEISEPYVETYRHQEVGPKVQPFESEQKTLEGWQTLVSWMVFLNRK